MRDLFADRMLERKFFGHIRFSNKAHCPQDNFLNTKTNCFSYISGSDNSKVCVEQLLHLQEKSLCSTIRK